MLRGRQAVLDRTDAPRLTCVLGESALRSPVGGPLVLGEQLNALVSQANRDNVEIRILPDHSGRPAGATSGFTELLLPTEIIQDFSEVVYVSTPVDRIHYESPETLAIFRDLWEQTKQATLSPEESTEVLADLARHARTAGLSMPGEFDLTPRSRIALLGAGPGFNGVWRVAELSRSLDVNRGFTQRLRLDTHEEAT